MRDENEVDHAEATTPKARSVLINVILNKAKGGWSTRRSVQTEGSLFIGRWLCN